MTLGIIGGAGSIGGAAIGANASKGAAKTQADATKYAANLQDQQFQQTQQNLQPWLQTGQFGLNQLMQGIQSGDLTKPFSDSFNAPTAADAQQTPGYQFTKDAGEKAILNANTAAGGAFSGATAKNLEVFDTGLADSTYQQTYNNALQNYNTRFNAYNVGQTNTFNRLASLAQTGQTAANQIGQFGQAAVTNEGNLITDAAAAKAAGQIGASNAYVKGINGLTSSLSTPIYLQQLMGSGFGGGFSNPGAGWVPNTSGSGYIPAPATYQPVAGEQGPLPYISYGGDV